MKQLLSVAGRALYRALVAAMIVYGVGVLAAPDLNKIYLVGVATLIGVIGSGVSAIQHYETKFSFVRYLGSPIGDWADSFLQAFIGSLCVTLPGLVGAPDLNTYRSLGSAVIVGAFNAGIRALQGAMTHGEQPAPAVGVKDPQKT